jgi:uncharacterized protein (TIGR00369 family)
VTDVPDSEPVGSISAAFEADQQSGGDMFSAPALHSLLGLKLLEFGPQGVVVEMPVAAEAFNSTGNLHGGAIATLIDVAAGTAAALGSGFEPGKNTIVTADLHVRYLGRPKGDRVRAVARVVKAGRQLVVVDCQVLDDMDRVIASCDFSSMIVPLRDPLKPTPIARKDDPDL